MLHTKFHCKRPTVSGQVDFKVIFIFFLIYGHDGHLGHVTKTSLYFYIRASKIFHVVFGKKIILKLNDLWRRSKNNIDL